MLLKPCCSRLPAGSTCCSESVCHAKAGVSARLLRLSRSTPAAVLPNAKALRVGSERDCVQQLFEPSGLGPIFSRWWFLLQQSAWAVRPRQNPLVEVVVSTTKPKSKAKPGRRRLLRRITLNRTARRLPNPTWHDKDRSSAVQTAEKPAEHVGSGRFPKWIQRLDPLEASLDPNTAENIS